MEKLSMCRICLVKNVPMFGVVNKDLHELYEKLTDIPFVTEDKRPILACFLCCAKLKQCFRFMRKCLEAEELFAQMNERNPLINTEHFEFCSGFTRSPIEQIDIVEILQTESIELKEEPVEAVCEGLDDIDETDEYQEDIKDIPLEHSESDSEDDAPIKGCKIVVDEEIEESKLKRRAVEANRAPVTKKPKLDTRRTNLEETITVVPTTVIVKKNEQLNFTTRSQMHTGEKSHHCDVCQRSFSQKRYLIAHNRIHTSEKPYQCVVCESSFNKKWTLIKHIRIHTGERPYQCEVCQRSFSDKSNLVKHFRTHTGEKPYQCEVCQRSFSEKGSLTKHFRIHTGEMPFKCNVCQGSFRDKRHLSSHK